MKQLDSQEELDEFLLREVGPLYDARKADPSRLLTAEQLQDSLDEWDREGIREANEEMDRDPSSGVAIEDVAKRFGIRLPQVSEE